MAFLNRGLEIAFRDERVEPQLDVVFKYDGGITDFVRHLNASKEPISENVISFDESTETSEVDLAMQWNTGYHEGLHSLREQHRHHRGRDARGGLQEGPHERGQQVRPRRRVSSRRRTRTSSAKTSGKASPRSSA